jgi:hypothetical protein
MEIYSNAFIGIVDILGYGKLETRLKEYGIDPSIAIITQIFSFLDNIVDRLQKNTNITWNRYGDGYVCYSKDSDIENLCEMVKRNCMLIALSLNQSIPLRIAITQNTISVDITMNGLTISGQGWDVLIEIEKSLDWMGGFLYLPNFDGSHYDTVQNLIQTTYLIKEQNHIPEVKFCPPFKQKLNFITDTTWFLNWQKCFHQPKNQVDKDIENWWSQFAQGSKLNTSEKVKVKQKNSINFADYCRALNQASNLIYYSEINRNIDIFTINGTC